MGTDLDLKQWRYAGLLRSSKVELQIVVLGHVDEQGLVSTQQMTSAAASDSSA